MRHDNDKEAGKAQANSAGGTRSQEGRPDGMGIAQQGSII